ncbi:hypothetical protein E2C01_003358 [Portunus trituberculatus]|uniref:Uncharacterized protein n=1 Tax=Portunus trituberculatus TaxID=210409 RepID=A0A5B7CNN4_PORTR|nr:hypothetical protein [Portunus trituberculatus]
MYNTPAPASTHPSSAKHVNTAVRVTHQYWTRHLIRSDATADQTGHHGCLGGNSMGRVRHTPLRTLLPPPVSRSTG